MDDNPYIASLVSSFQKQRNEFNAVPMKAYMKGRFEFLGIKSPQRKALTRPFLESKMRPSASAIWEVIHALWNRQEREFQYFALDLLEKYKRHVREDWIENYEGLIVNKSWWDTVDALAANHVGHYFKVYPSMIPEITNRWMASKNLWLQRSCLLFQLKYKMDTDERLLQHCIENLSTSREFFIAKAIGWSLRQYAKFNPEWVVNFVDSHELQPLSKREALRLIR